MLNKIEDMIMISKEKKNVLIKICDRHNHFSEEFHASNSPCEKEFDDLNGSEGNFGIRHKLAILRCDCNLIVIFESALCGLC